MQEDRALKWNQHPVISTVLWILGTAEGNTSDANGRKLSQNDSAVSLSISTSSTAATSSSSSGPAKERIVWKDQKGGTINEYFSLQSPPNPSPSNTSLGGSMDSQPFSPTPGSRSHSGSMDSEAIDLRTQRNTVNNIHHNIYNPDAASNTDNNTPGDDEVTLRPHVLHANEAHPDGHHVVGPGSADTTQSPSWGFYVPITPPQHEVFPHHHLPPYSR
jgi:hypothetical protein